MKRPLLAGFLVALVPALLFVVKGGAGGPGIQPIAFNHARHVSNGIGCTDCHSGAESEERATIPALEACMACHESALTKSAEEERLRGFAAAGTEIAWRPVTQLPSHVFFSHRRHAGIAGLKCQECHGAMEKLTAPPRAPLRPLTMAACMSCHQHRNAGNECNDCHR